METDQNQQEKPAEKPIDYLSTTEPLASSLLKVMRASQQISELAGHFRAFLDTKPYRILRSIDHKDGRAVFRADVREPCPEIWSVWIGECIHNLRSALDYMVWDLVILETGAPPTTNKTQFPIFEFQAGYNDRGKHLLKGVGSKARTVIKATQPFSTGEDRRSPLWHLHELSNWDKHRSLRLTGAHLQSYERLDMPEVMAQGTVTGYEVRRPAGPFQHRTVLLTMTFTGCWTESSSDVEVDAKSSFDISFDQIGPVPSSVVIPTLLLIHKRVYEIGKELAEFWPASDASPPHAKASAV